jgi:hypothetical protein
MIDCNDDDFRPAIFANNIAVVLDAEQVDWRLRAVMR